MVRESSDTDQIEMRGHKLGSEIAWGRRGGDVELDGYEVTCRAFGSSHLQMAISTQSRLEVKPQT